MSSLQRVVIAASVLLLTAAGAAAQSAERPNVVLVIADDLGWGDLGSYGSPVMRTPRLDRLAAQGVRFTAAYVAAAVCSPSRAGLMTGRYPQRHGYEFNTSGRDVEIGLSTDERTLGDLMRGAGYATGYVGKWHLGRRPAQQPLSRGFDEYFGLLTGGTTYFAGDHPEAVLDPDRPAGTRAGREIYRGREVVEVDDYLTDVFTREAVDFIDRRAGGDAPFFLVLSYNAPHTPLQATREYMDTVAHVEDFRTRIYAAMVSSVDRGVGAVVDRLAAHGVDDDTVVVFMSDNGCVGYAAIACSNGPFSGTKRFHLEGGIRIPFIMHWPNGLEGGQVYREPVISLDLFATFAGLAGASVDDGVVRDGVDLVPYLTGDADGRPHDVLYWRAGPQPRRPHGPVEALRGQPRRPRRLTRRRPAPPAAGLPRRLAPRAGLAALRPRGRRGRARQPRRPAPRAVARPPGPARPLGVVTRPTGMAVQPVHNHRDRRRTGSTVLLTPLSRNRVGTAWRTAP